MTGSRLKLAMKDAEIQRLQASLQSREAEDQSTLIENLRTDMTALIEKNQRSRYSLSTYSLNQSYNLHCKKQLKGKISLYYLNIGVLWYYENL